VSNRVLLCVRLYMCLYVSVCARQIHTHMSTLSINVCDWSTNVSRSQAFQVESISASKSAHARGARGGVREEREA